MTDPRSSMAARTTVASPVVSESGSRHRTVRLVWWPGLVVALGAAVATAHGLYEVAVAARVPGGIAWLYPLITDGLALVAYAATARLAGQAARYAWAIVVVAAGLSGLAQAVYLASDSTVDGPAVLRFGVGAWPAIAAAVVAHLLYLLSADPDDAASDEQRHVAGSAGPPTKERAAATRTTSGGGERSTSPVQPAAVQPASNAPPTVQAAPFNDGEADPPDNAPTGVNGRAVDRPFGPGASLAGRPASERAHTAAWRLARCTGTWPTVSALEAEADVGRGTAAAVLKNLRDQPPGLHLINAQQAAPPDHDLSDQQETRP